jgi:hypothetical protein
VKAAVAVVRREAVSHITAMKRRSLETVSSKVSVKGQTVIPREVRALASGFVP